MNTRKTPEFGKLLKKVRAKTKKSQAEVANQAGISLSVYVKYEHGSNQPCFYRIWKALADVFKWTQEESDKYWEKMTGEMTSKMTSK